MSGRGVKYWPAPPFTSSAFYISYPKRLRELEELLEIEYDKYHEFQKEIAISTGNEKILLKQRVKRELLPELRRLENQYGKLLARYVSGRNLPEEKSQQLVSGVSRALAEFEKQTAGIASSEATRLREETQAKLNQSGEPASAKLKIIIPIIPLIATYELELQTGRIIADAWREAQDFFRSVIIDHPDSDKGWGDWRRRVSLLVIGLGVVGVVLIAFFSTQNLLFEREFPKILKAFVNQRITAKLNEYHTGIAVKNGVLDDEILRRLETEYKLRPGKLTQRYLGRIQSSAPNVTADPEQLADLLSTYYRFREAETLALSSAKKAEEQALPDEVICRFYINAGWMALCQDGYAGQFSQWLSVTEEQYQRAGEWFRIADGLARDRQLPQRAGTQYGVATVCFRRGDCKGAESPIRNSVVLRLNTPGAAADNPSDLGASTLLGQVLLECGDVAEGEKTLKAVYDTWLKFSPTKQEAEVVVLRNKFKHMSWCDWANALRAQRNVRAEHEHESAVSSCRTEFGADDLVTLYCRYNYARTLSEFGKHEKANSEFGETIKVLKSRHPAAKRLTSDACYYYACLLKQLGKVEEARSIAKSAFECRLALLGQEHPDTSDAEKLIAELKSTDVPKQRSGS